MTFHSNNSRLLSLSAEIITSHVSGNTVPAEALPGLIRSVFAALATAGTVKPPAERQEPKVLASRSVFDDHIVCIECGKSFKMLKRHLRNNHALTPGEYRAKWGLHQEYQMVAADSTARRSELATSIGFGRRSAAPVATAAAAEVVQRKRGRPKKVD